jgi:trigger factor
LETSAERLENNKVEVTVTVGAQDVDKAIASTYKDLAKRYRFPGFRPGHAPRPVIDSQLGHDAVMAQASQELVEKVEPQVREKEDVVPVGDAQYPEPATVEPGKDFVFKVQYEVRPELKLNSYDPVDIVLPSDEASEDEVNNQIETFRGYFGKYEDIEGRGVEADDYTYIKLSAPEEYKQLNFENRLYKLGSGMMPEAFDQALLGMKPGEEKKDVTIELPQGTPAEGEEAPEPETVKLDVTLNRLVEHVLPELDDQFAKDKFGFDDVKAMREAISKEIGDQKKAQLPQVKENRVTGALAKRLDGEPTPSYVQTVFQELGQNFMTQLQSRGMTLDGWLAANGMQPQDFMSDLNRQATDIASESLALDALVAEKGFDCTEEDIDEEFKKAGVPDWEATKKEFLDEGRMPAVRVSIRRNKAIDWLLETAKVTISDVDPDAAEAGEAAEDAKDEAKPAKKTTRKSSSKKAAEKDQAPADDAKAADEAKPAKKATRKPSAKKAAAAATDEAEQDKPAAKKPAAKKSAGTKKAASAKTAEAKKDDETKAE